MEGEILREHQKKHFVTEDEAEHLAGGTEKLFDLIEAACREDKKGGELLLLETGAKLYVDNSENKYRFYITGYTPNGSDVEQIIDELDKRE